MPDASSLPPSTRGDDELTADEYDEIFENAELYYECCLRIRPKEGKEEGATPLVLNAIQKIVHQKAEDQLRRTGRVRLIILKGRQMGVSTYVGARFYRKASLNHGQLVYIVTHEDAATQNLFGMAKRYHENCLQEFKPATRASNANELAFADLDSAYKIATAGARSAGRSATVQCLHASEFDFWPNATAGDVWTGLTEALAEADGSECFIESTAFVPGGRFHRAWKAAKRGESAYEALFLPWFWHEDYRAEPPEGWVPPAAFVEYGVLHSLSPDRLYWAWLKNRNMAMTYGTSPDEFCPEFKREYPATDEEAFETAGDDFIRVFPRRWIKAAQARWLENRGLPLMSMSGLGVDPAQGGADRSAFAPWHGPRLEKLTALPGAATPDGPAIAAIALTHLRNGAPLGIDVTGGHGGDAYTHCHKHLELQTLGVNSSEGSSAKTRDGKQGFPLVRDEMHWALREGLNPENGENLELPPDEELEEEMLAVTFEPTPRGIKIVSKDVIRDLLKRSPDKLDATLIGYRTAKHYFRVEQLPDRVRRKVERMRKHAPDVLDTV